MAGFPGVFGCVDGTHVVLKRPQQDEEAYVNRKNRHSINVQVCFQSSMMEHLITQVYTQYGKQCCIHASVHQVSIASDNGLSPIRRQAIIQTNAGKQLIGPLGTNFSENWIKIRNFWFKKMHLQISSAKQLPFCPGGDELTTFNERAITSVPILPFPL